MLRKTIAIVAVTILLVAAAVVGVRYFGQTEAREVADALSALPADPNSMVAARVKRQVSPHARAAIPANAQISPTVASWQRFGEDLGTIEVAVNANGVPATYLTVMHKEQSGWKVAATLPRPGSLGAGLNNSGRGEADSAPAVTPAAVVLPTAPPPVGPKTPAPKLQTAELELLTSHVIPDPKGGFVPVLVVSDNNDSRLPLDSPGAAADSSFAQTLQTRSAVLGAQLTVAQDNPQDSGANVSAAVRELKSLGKNNVMVIAQGAGITAAQAGLTSVAGDVAEFVTVATPLGVTGFGDAALVLLESACPENDADPTCTALHRSTKNAAAAVPDLPALPAELPQSTITMSVGLHAPRAGWFGWAPSPNRLLLPADAQADGTTTVRCNMDVSANRKQLLIDTGPGAKPVAEAASACFAPLTSSVVAEELLTHLDELVAPHTAVTPTDLLSAPVPALCDQPAANLVNGVHPNSPEYLLRTQADSTLFGPVDGLGGLPAVGILNCGGKADKPKETVLAAWTVGPALGPVISVTDMKLKVPDPQLDSLFFAEDKVMGLVSSTTSTARGNFEAVVVAGQWQVTDTSDTSPHGSPRPLADQMVQAVNAKDTATLNRLVTSETGLALTKSSTGKSSVLDELSELKGNVADCRQGTAPREVHVRDRNAVVCSVAKRKGSRAFHTADYWVTLSPVGSTWKVTAVTTRGR